MREEELLPSVQSGEEAESGVGKGRGFDLPTDSEQDRKTKTQKAWVGSNRDEKKGKI